MIIKGKNFLFNGVGFEYFNDKPEICVDVKNNYVSISCKNKDDVMNLEAIVILSAADIASLVRGYINDMSFKELIAFVTKEKEE